MNAITFPTGSPLARPQPGLPSLARAFSDRFRFARTLGIDPTLSALTADTSARRYLPTSDPRFTYNPRTASPNHVPGTEIQPGNPHGPADVPDERAAPPSARSVIVLSAIATDRSGKSATSTAFLLIGPAGILRPVPTVTGSTDPNLRRRLAYAIRGLTAIAVARTADGRPTGGLRLSPDDPGDGIQIDGGYTGYPLP